MWRVTALFLFFIYVQADDHRTVIFDDGGVRGEKYWNGDYYEFYGIPYATVPKGRDRFQGPLPATPWKGTMDAKNSKIICHQTYYTDDETDEFILSGEEECLVMNVLVPEIATEKNLLPVLVYIHSGAYSGGNGNMAKYNYLARHDVVVVSFNYRVGPFGFVCLGNEEIPGNAGLKDQVAALKWIQKNIKKFGGDPNKVTLAGFSVGAAMAELHALSPRSQGLFDKLILESGSAFSPFAINGDPVSTARNIAISIGFNDTGKLEDLTEFYLNATVEDLVSKSINFFLPNSTFGFAPCIENIHSGIEPFLTESPRDIMKRSLDNKVAVLTGYSNMEGISRLIQFGPWREGMNEDFSKFLPADLRFPDDKTKNEVAKLIREHYFKDSEITVSSIQDYINYFSDSMFKYSIIKSAKFNAKTSGRPTFFYEFSYVGKLNMKHNYMDHIQGASHRDQTAYLLDFFGWTNSYKDLDTRDRMTTMWTDFVKYENPTAYESALITAKWQPFTIERPSYLNIDRKLIVKSNLPTETYELWDKVYDKYYWNPGPPQ